MISFWCSNVSQRDCSPGLPVLGGLAVLERKIGKDGALDGAFWGMLFGLIFFVPFFGMAIGAAMGALAGKFTDYGIDDDFIKSVQGKVTEGTSALFLMTSDAVLDKVADAFKGIEFEIVTTNLSNEEEEELREAFGA